MSVSAASAGPITLDVEGLPGGVTAGKSNIAANAGSAEIALKAEPRAVIRSTRLTVRGTAELAGKNTSRIASRPASASLPTIDSVRLAVAMPTPFSLTGPQDFGWAPRGSVRHRKYRIDRKGFKGPIQVQLADRQARHLQGVTGAILTVPPGVDEFDYAVVLPPGMEIGRTSRTVVMASGVVHEPDGSTHEVSYSSPGAEVQMVAVIEPGRLGVEPLRTSIAIEPGKIVEIPFKLSRSERVSGPVRVGLVIPVDGPGRYRLNRSSSPRARTTVSSGSNSVRTPGVPGPPSSSSVPSPVRPRTCSVPRPV